MLEGIEGAAMNGRLLHLDVDHAEISGIEISGATGAGVALHPRTGDVWLHDLTVEADPEVIRRPGAQDALVVVYVERSAAADICLTSLHVSGAVRRDGLAVLVAPGSRLDRLEIRDNDVSGRRHHRGFDGIAIHGRVVNFDVVGNHIRGFRHAGVAAGSDGAGLGPPEHGAIEGNDVDRLEPGQPGRATRTGVRLTGADDVRVRSNRIETHRVGVAARARGVSVVHLAVTDNDIQTRPSGTWAHAEVFGPCSHGGSMGDVTAQPNDITPARDKPGSEPPARYRRPRWCGFDPGTQP